ncbi:hypothetical protein BV898_03026 [Hypsibius exemplaris]|uniref:Chitin synthase chs-1/2 N-terminal putative transporter domain-containing protein n=1 Tax=Hypsibius exemplaris TaxID=2072580 RepID=A0A1W0X673_HYPEX|nr:hypothetical protein BV898_03026 [Hypsibius exemplaris]
MEITSASVYGEDEDGCVCDSPTPDQEYYEISSCKSHIFRRGGGPSTLGGGGTLQTRRSGGAACGDGVSRTSSFYGAAAGPSGYPSHHQMRRMMMMPQHQLRQGPTSDAPMEPKHDGWDAFKLQSVEVPKRCDKVFFDAVLQVSKVAAYVITFLLILLSGIVSKLSLVLLTSNLLNSTGPERKCASPHAIASVKSNSSKLLAANRVPDVIHSGVDYREKYVAVIWSICFCVLAPEICTWLSCFRKVTLRQIQGPKTVATWILAFLSETLHTLGILLFLYEVLAGTDLLSGLFLTSACFLIPSMLTLCSRTRADRCFPFNSSSTSRLASRNFPPSFTGPSMTAAHSAGPFPYPSSSSRSAGGKTTSPLSRYLGSSDGWLTIELMLARPRRVCTYSYPCGKLSLFWDGWRHGMRPLPPDRGM